MTQAPLSIPYQAVVRNADGSVMANAALTLTFKIHDVTATGAIVYHETHSLSSNAQGLVVCAVGSGTAVQGTFAGIQWGSGAKFMQVLMNPGSGEIDLGTQQLMSVPYALYSNGINVNVSATGDTLTIGVNHIVVPGISAANVNNNTIPTSGLGSVVLPGNATCANEFISVTGCGGQTTLTYDGRTYDLVEIGGQCWFADNLATDQYRNGDSIPTGLDNTTWQNTTSGAYAIYNNSFSSDSIYGKLYNGYAIMDNRELCPTGWSMPSDCDWMYLENSLGMNLIDQQLQGARGNENVIGLKASDGWGCCSINSLQTSQFKAYPGGFREDYGNYYHQPYWAFFGSSSFTDPNAIWLRGVYFGTAQISRDASNLGSGISVRCIKDLTLPSVLGCTDGSACNFSVGANQDDGSCLYQNATCDDGNANTMNDLIDGNCQCNGVLLISGCTNPLSCNFNLTANVDDGTCLIQGVGCNDGSDSTFNDVIDSFCNCVGILFVNGGMGQEVFQDNPSCSDQHISITGCNGENQMLYFGYYIDLVEIGGQCWFADNVPNHYFNDGQSITFNLPNSAYNLLGGISGPASSVYSDANYQSTYGVLLNWYAVNSSLNVCPVGWHVPSDCEWKYLENSLGMSVLDQNTIGNGIYRGGAGYEVGRKLKSNQNWNGGNCAICNSSGISISPGGMRTSTGSFSSVSSYGISSYGQYWTSTQDLDGKYILRRFAYNKTGVERSSLSGSYEMSVRCLKD